MQSPSWTKVNEILEADPRNGWTTKDEMWNYLRYETNGLDDFSDDEIDYLTAYELAAAAGMEK